MLTFLVVWLWIFSGILSIKLTGEKFKIKEYIPFLICGPLGLLTWFTHNVWESKKLKDEKTEDLKEKS